VVSSRLMTFQQPGIMEFRARAAPQPIDRILRGAKPGDLPIERPARFELVLNLATTKRLGITIPGSMRVQAAKLIE
jgi:putative ABC transport system substrate-binding protein